MVAILFCFVGIGTGIVALSTTAWQIPGVGLLESCTAILGIESCGFNLRKMIFFSQSNNMLYVEGSQTRANPSQERNFSIFEGELGSHEAKRINYR